MIKISLIVAASLVVASCGTPAEPTAPQPQLDGAPAVSEPRDVRPYAAEPCGTLLDATTWRALGFAATGTPRTVASGQQSCRWTGPNRERTASVTVVPNVDILSRSYEVRLFPIFQPITVGALPAAQEQGSADSVSCTVTVGTARDQGFVIMYDDQQLGPNGEADDPCGHAREIAGRIVAQLPPLTK